MLLMNFMYELMAVGQAARDDGSLTPLNRPCYKSLFDFQRAPIHAAFAKKSNQKRERHLHFVF